MIFSSEVTVLERGSREEHKREERRRAALRDRYGMEGLPDRALCHVVDMSKNGARLEVYCDLPLSTTISLKLPNAHAVRARVLWSNDREAGLRFLHPLKDAELETIFQKGHA